MADEYLQGFSQAALAGEYRVQSSGVLSAVEAEAYMQRIIERVYVGRHMNRSDENSQHIRVGVLMTGIVKGSSSRDPYTGVVEVPGGNFPANIIAVILGDTMRRFFRAYADIARKFLITQKDKEWVIENARKWGVGVGHSDLAFDFSDYCTGLTDQEISRINVVTNIRTAGVRVASGDTYIPGVPDVIPERGETSGSHGYVGRPVNPNATSLFQ